MEDRREPRAGLDRNGSTFRPFQAAMGKTGLGEDKPFRQRLTLTSHSE
jgi:hypothetical protein